MSNGRKKKSQFEKAIDAQNKRLKEWADKVAKKARKL